MFPIPLQAEIMKNCRVGGFQAGWWLEGLLIEFCRWGAAHSPKGTGYAIKSEGRWPRGLFLQPMGRFLNSKESSGLHTCQAYQVAKPDPIFTACGKAEGWLTLGSPAHWQIRGPNDPRNPRGGLACDRKSPCKQCRRRMVAQRLLMTTVHLPLGSKSTLGSPL